MPLAGSDSTRKLVVALESLRDFFLQRISPKKDRRETTSLSLTAGFNQRWQNEAAQGFTDRLIYDSFKRDMLAGFKVQTV